MSAKNSRIKATTYRNRLDFEIDVDRVSHVQTELRRLEAERDAAVLVAQQTHSAEIAEYKAELETKVAKCSQYATANRAALLTADAKSVDTPHSRYGFRLGQKRLVTLSKWSWPKVLIALAARNLTDYIRQKPEVDKDAMLIDAKKHEALVIHDPCGSGEIQISLSDVGVKVVQDDDFFIEPKVAGGTVAKKEAA